MKMGAKFCPYCGEKLPASSGNAALPASEERSKGEESTSAPLTSEGSIASEKESASVSLTGGESDSSEKGAEERTEKESASAPLAGGESAASEKESGEIVEKESAAAPMTGEESASSERDAEAGSEEESVSAPLVSGEGAASEKESAAAPVTGEESTSSEKDAEAGSEEESVSAPLTGEESASSEEGTFTLVTGNESTSSERGSEEGSKEESSSAIVTSGGSIAGELQGTVSSGAWNPQSRPEEGYHYTVEEPKKKGINLLLIGLLAIIGIFLIAFFAFGANTLLRGGGGAKKQFVNLQKQLFLEKSEGLRKLGFFDIDRDFSTDLTITASVDGSAAADEINQQLEDSSVVMKLDTSEKRTLFDLRLNYMGSDILKLFTSYDSEKGKVGFYLPDADENYYVADLKTLYQNMTDEEIELPDEKKVKENRKEALKIYNRYFDLVTSMINKKNLKLSREEVSLERLGEHFKGKVYTFRPDAEEMRTMLRELADKMEDDEELSDFLKKMNQENMLGFTGQKKSDKDIERMIRDGADEIREKADEYSKELESEDLSWVVATEKGKVRLIRIESKSGSLSYERGKDGDGKITECLSRSDASGTVVLENSYRVKGKNYEGKISLEGPGVPPRAALVYDFDSGKHSVFLPYGDYELRGMDDLDLSLRVEEGEKGSSLHTFSLDGLESLSLPLSGAELRIQSTDKSTAELPQKEETDISGYSKEELAQLAEQIAGKLEGVLQSAMDGDLSRG